MAEDNTGAKSRTKPRSKSQFRPRSKPQAKQCGIQFSLSLLHPRFWLTWLLFLKMLVIGQLTTAWRHALGRWIGNYIYRYNKKRRNVVDTNLRIAFPQMEEKERDALVRKNLQWYACAMLDYSLLFFASKRRLSNLLQVDGKEHIDKAIESNQSIMMLLAHSTMLEFAPRALGCHYELYGSYKTSKNALLDWMITKSRCRFVKFVVSRDEGLRKLVKALNPDRLMVFLPDEDLGIDNAVFVPFFGTNKATLTTTSRIAKMGKAIALPIFSWYDEDLRKYRTQVLPAIKNYPSGNVEDDAKALNIALEELIKQHPEQYMWQMKWYRTRPEGEPSLYQAL